MTTVHITELSTKVTISNVPEASVVRVIGYVPVNVIDHGALYGLADDDHTQYYNAARHTKAVHDLLGLDHGSLSGLTDDDHAQYLHLNKTAQSILQSPALNYLTASLPVVTDASKYLVSLAYTGATSLRKNLGLETSDSPTFTGLTVGALAGVLKATAGVLAGSAVHADLGSIGANDHHAQIHAASHHTGGGDLLAHQSIPGSGTLTHATIDSYLDQAVKQASSPTFAGLTTQNGASILHFAIDGGDNVIEVQQQNADVAGQSAIRFLDYQGNEKVAIGYGNRRGTDLFDKKAFIEIGALTVGDLTHPTDAAIINTHGVEGGSLPVGGYQMQQWYEDGRIIFYAPTPSFHNSLAMDASGNWKFANTIIGNQSEGGPLSVLRFGGNDSYPTITNALYGLGVSGGYLIVSAHNSGLGMQFGPYNGTTFTPKITIQTESGVGNLGIGITAFGTSADKVLGLGSGTAPSTSPVDMAQMWVADKVEGNAVFKMRTELGTVLTFDQDVGSSATPTFPGIVITDAGTIGLGTGKGLIQFDDETVDTISFLNSKVFITGTAQSEMLEVSSYYPRIIIKSTSVSANYAAGFTIDATLQSANAKWTFLTGQIAEGQAASALSIFNSLYGLAYVVVQEDGKVGIGDTAPGELLDVAGNINATGVLKIDDVQVISNRVVDARIDDAINESTWDATTAGVLDAIRDAMISHGLMAAS